LIVEEWSKNRFLNIFVLIVMAGIVVGLFYRAYKWPVGQSGVHPPEKKTKTVSTSKARSPIQGHRVTLLRGRPVTAWKNKLVYHGLDNGRIHIAVYILDLDPEVPYHHKIPIKEAKKGFRLGGQKFQLEAYGKHRIRLAAPDLAKKGGPS